MMICIVFCRVLPLTTHPYTVTVLQRSKRDKSVGSVACSTAALQHCSTMPCSTLHTSQVTPVLAPAIALPNTNTNNNTNTNTNNSNSSKEFPLLTVQQVPEQHKEISIISGYRQRLDYEDCLRSIFRLHNETVNIWTHLLGFLVFFMLMVKDLVWAQEHIRDTADYGATALQLLTYQVTLQQHNTSLAILSGNQKSTNAQCNGHL